MTVAVTENRDDVSRLPALIDRACHRLSEARTSAEVLEARALGEAALHFAKVTKAANETHADCLRMIVRAEMRMATEVDAGQSRGEVSTGGRPEKPSEPRTVSEATLNDLGVSRQRLSEWRDVRDAGMEVVDTAISGALLEGRAPTKADVRRAVDERRQPVAKRQKPGPPSDGMQFARLAVMRLEEIRPDDTQRSEAFAYVRSWIDAREAGREAEA
jgi:hypothetical protein